MLLQSMVSVVSRAMLARILFAAHSVIAISQMVEVYGETSYWGFTLLTCSIFIEGFMTILQRDGREAKWFCPSVFLYLCSVVPPIWYLQLDLSSKHMKAFQNQTTYEDLEKRQDTEDAHSHLGIRFKIRHELWIQMLEQTLLVVLIVGRWLLPKGDITREQLSQILLAYLAIASDIVELFDMFKDPAVKSHEHLPRLILAAWTLSLLQFPLVLTTSKARKMRVALTTSNSDEEVKRLQYIADCEVNSRPRWVRVLGDIDVWAIFVACFVQDLPFLSVRLYLMLGYHVMDYTMIFFTCKNLLVILLQFYRLIVIIHERYRGSAVEEDARRLTQHYRQMLHACKDVLSKLKEEGSSQMHNMHLPRRKKKNVARNKPHQGSTSSAKQQKKSDKRFEDIQETDELSSPKCEHAVVNITTNPTDSIDVDVKKSVRNGGDGVVRIQIENIASISELSSDTDNYSVRSPSSAVAGQKRDSDT